MKGRTAGEQLGREGGEQTRRRWANESNEKNQREGRRERKRERWAHTGALPACFSCCKRPFKTDRFHLAHQADASGDCSLSLPLSLPSLSWLFWLVNYFIQHICCIDAWIIHQLHVATIISCYFYLPGSMCSTKQFKVLLARFLQQWEANYNNMRQTKTGGILLTFGALWTNNCFEYVARFTCVRVQQS